MRTELLIQPTSSTHRPPPPSFSVLKESLTDFYLPRCFAFSKHGAAAAGVKFPAHTSIDVPFAGELRPIQQTVVDAYLQEARHGSGSGTVVLGCGGGKTCTALFITHALAVKTLVVVHKTFLLDQWKDRIGQFLPTAKVGIMKGGKFEHEGCDIVIASLQTMISRKHPLTGFGLTIYDETHHMSARVFVTSLMVETTRYTLGLTATPDRKDGLGYVFTWFIGRIVYRQDDSDMKRTDVRVRTPKLLQRDTARYDHSGRPDTVAMVSDLCNNVERTREIADMALDVLKDPLRCVLVLSERRKHLEDIHTLLEGAHGHEIGYYVGGMKASEREDVERDARVIMASVSAAAEGFDVPRLNCIILASPRSDVEQSVGRIMRTPAGVGPLHPLIIDPYDPLFPGASKKRRALYKKRGYKLEKESDHEACDEQPRCCTFDLGHLLLVK